VVVDCKRKKEEAGRREIYFTTGSDLRLEWRGGDCGLTNSPHDPSTVTGPGAALVAIRQLRSHVDRFFLGTQRAERGGLNQPARHGSRQKKEGRRKANAALRPADRLERTGRVGEWGICDAAVARRQSAISRGRARKRAKEGWARAGTYSRDSLNPLASPWVLVCQAGA